MGDGAIYPRLRLLDSSGAELSGSYWSWTGTMAYRSSGASGVGASSQWTGDYFSPEEMIHSNDANRKNMWDMIIVDPYDSGWDCSIRSYANFWDGTYVRVVDSAGAYATHATYRGFKLYVNSGNLLSGTEISVYALKRS